MAFEYRQRSKYEPSRIGSQCKASVPALGVGFAQCSRKPWRDGWCKQHHPEEEKARRDKSMEKHRAKQAALAEARKCKACQEKDAEIVLLKRRANKAAAIVATMHLPDYGVAQAAQDILNALRGDDEEVTDD